METIHARLKRLRTEKGVSLEEVAAALGVSWQTVQQWELDTDKGTAPARKRQKAVADYFGVSVPMLLTGEKFAVSKKGAEETPLVPPGDSRLPIQSGPGKELLELLSSGALREAEVSVLTTTAKLFASGRARKNRQLHESAEFLPPVGDTTGVSKKLIRELTEKK